MTRGCCFLDKKQVSTIWNAASFSIQELGQPLNFGLEFTQSQDTKAAASTFVHSLMQRIRDWSSGETKLPWLIVLSSPKIGVHSTFVAAGIPSSLLSIFSKWFSRQTEANIASNWRTIPHNGERPLQQHFKILSRATESTNPNVIVRRDGKQVRLVDLISPNALTSNHWLPFTGRRLEVASCIGRAGQQAASEGGLPMISAFDDKAFGWLKTGWEIQEHEDRKLARASLRKAQSVIEQKFPAGISGLVDSKRGRELEALLPPFRTGRWPRTWTPWWLTRMN